MKKLRKKNERLGSKKEHSFKDWYSQLNLMEVGESCAEKIEFKKIDFSLET